MSVKIIYCTGKALRQMTQNDFMIFKVKDIKKGQSGNFTLIISALILKKQHTKQLLVNQKP
jgi:hypothetical protein